jgi:outer membrane biosynthesis protein TonB
VDSDDQKKECLSKALAINPNNENTRTALALFEKLPQPSVAEMRPVALTKPSVFPEKKEEESKKSNDKTEKLQQTESPQQKSTHVPANLKASTTINSRKKVPFEWVLLGILAGLIIVVSAGIIILLNSRPTAKSLAPTITSTHNLPLAQLQISPTATVSKTTQSVSISCQQNTQNYVGSIRSYLTEFTDTIKVAASTSRIALGPLVQVLQKDSRSISETSAPSCAQGASSLLSRGLDSTINGLLDFMGNESETVYQAEINQGALDAENATEQLGALTSGQPTPIPNVLPTNTPVPTLRPAFTSTPVPTMVPTSTPYPPGSEVMFGDWQIKVEKVMVTDKVTRFGSIYKAKGQFALIFMTAVNRDTSPHTWMGFDTIELQDSNGTRYTENVDGSAGAAETYNRPDYFNGTVTNPDVSISVVTAFDIPVGTHTYVLVQARDTIQTQTTGTLLINVP